LEYPQYTKPREYRGLKVPEVLLSGNHSEIAKWRKQKSIIETSIRRPDLLPKINLNLDQEKLSCLPPIYLSLIHYPVVDKHNKLVTSSITNLDVHDIARSVKTFNLNGFFVVHPSRVLRALIQKVCDHWSHGAGFEYNPNRSEALAKVISIPSLDDAISMIEKEHGVLPRLVVTSARPGDRMLDYKIFKDLLVNIKEPVLILFGTAWGLDQSVLDKAEYRLNPIWGPGEYNHLSVRSAVAIILDRLFGS
jgi:tRNA (guanine37-N1)-methyltransferase